MKLCLIIIAILVSLYAGDDYKWTSNKNCKGCHKEIYSTWETSRHTNSHFAKNDLYSKTLTYIAKENPQMLLEEVKISCAKCHNPKIFRKSMNAKEKILLAMGNNSVKKGLNRELNANVLREGISCMVCHNIRDIHLNKEEGSQGLGSVIFGSSDTMVGPLFDANSPYHKTEGTKHFATDNPQLCFVCHYSTKNSHGIEVYATGKEYDAVASDEGCKSCHMSKKTKGFASNYAAPGEKPTERMVRKHQFKSVDNSMIFRDYVDISGKKSAENFVITIQNNTPHKVPTGYGLREVIVEASFYDTNKNRLGHGSYIIGKKWLDKKGEMTIPHLARTSKDDTRIGAKESKNYTFAIPHSASYVDYVVYYKLIGDTMAKKLNITDTFFTKKYTIIQERKSL